MSAHTLPQLVGRTLKAARDDTGASQDEVAAAARRSGLDWTRAAVASLETGRRGLTADELVMVPHLLAHLTRRDWTLSDLVHDATGDMTTPDGSRIGLEQVRRLLGGEGAWQSGMPSVGGRRPSSHADGVAAVGQVLEASWQGTVESDAAREAERHAMHVLGVEAETLVGTARGLWNRGLTEERDARVEARGDADSPRSLQAIRGHVTRELLDELRHDLEVRKDDR